MLSPGSRVLVSKKRIKKIMKTVDNHSIIGILIIVDGSE